jgi:hypothetical protein
VCPKCIQSHHSLGQIHGGKKDSGLHKIQEIDDVAKNTLDSYVQAYLEIEYLKENKKDQFHKRNSLFTRECRNFMMKLHKFVSHFLMQAQAQILGNIDTNYAKWTAQKAELT